MSRKHPEMHIHKAIFDWLCLKLPRAVIHHSPNELGMSGPAIKRQVAKHKRMGMRVGFPDFLVLLRVGLKCRTVGLEVKAGKNRQSDAQKDVENDFKVNLAEYYVVRSIDDVARIFEGQI